MQRTAGILALGLTRAAGAGRAGAATLPRLRVGLPAEPTTVDPHRAVLPVEQTVALLLYDPLVRTGRGGWPEPGVASAWEANERAEVWTFHLRADARWSDGEPVTASDFVASWRRLFDRATGAPLWELLRVVRNAGPVHACFGDPERLGVRAADERTLEVTTDGPAGYFPALASLWLSVPLRLDAAATGAVTNGPFVVREWTPGQEIVLAPNPYALDGAPAVEVQLLVGAGEDEHFAAFLRGEREVAYVPAGREPEVLGEPELAGRVVAQPLPATLWISLNTVRRPLDDVRLRRALARAIDRESFVREALPGAAVPAYGLVPPGVPGYDPGLAEQAGFDAETARRMLAAAGIAIDSMPELTLLHPPGRPARQAAVIAGQVHRHLGLRLRPVEHDVHAYVQALERREYDLALSGWQSRYPDPEDWFWLNFAFEKIENRTGWSNRAFDAAWRAAEETAVPDERLRHYAEAQRILLDEAPAIFLAHLQRLLVVQSWVHGVQTGLLDSLPGVSSYRRVRVEPGLGEGV